MGFEPITNGQPSPLPRPSAANTPPSAATPPDPAAEIPRLIEDLRIMTNRLRPSNLGLQGAGDSPAAQQSVRISTLADVAYRDTINSPSAGMGLKRVLDWMAQPPYGVDATKIPDQALQSAATFDGWLSEPANAASLGLRRLDQKNAGLMEPGGIVITKPGVYSAHARIGVYAVDSAKALGATDRGVLVNGQILPGPTPEQVSSIYVPAAWQQPVPSGESQQVR